MKRYLPLTVAVLIIVAGTMVHAYYTERLFRRVTADLRDFTERLPRVPLQIGPWKGREQPLGEDFKLTNCPEAFQRTYRHEVTGDEVNVYLVTGSGRNICIHSPDWCYASAGYKMQGNIASYRLPAEGLPSAAEFATAFFRHPEAQPGPQARGLRIMWTYSDDGNWRGPKLAKLTYTIRPALYKIYFSADATQDRSVVTDTAIPEFVKTALPVINETLFQESEN